MKYKKELISRRNTPFVNTEIFLCSALLTVCVRLKVNLQFT